MEERLSQADIIILLISIKGTLQEIEAIGPQHHHIDWNSKDYNKMALDFLFKSNEDLSSSSSLEECNSSKSYNVEKINPDKNLLVEIKKSLGTSNLDYVKKICISIEKNKEIPTNIRKKEMGIIINIIANMLNLFGTNQDASSNKNQQEKVVPKLKPYKGLLNGMFSKNVKNTNKQKNKVETYSNGEQEVKAAIVAEEIVESITVDQKDMNSTSKPNGKKSKKYVVSSRETVANME